MPEDQRNINNIFPKFVVCVFFLLLGFWVGRYLEVPFLPNNQAKLNVANKAYSKDNVDFASFWQVWDELNKEFLFKKDLSSQKLLQGTIKGLVEAAGDPYTSYFDPDANKSFTDEISGTFEGVGMELGYKDNKLVVIAPLEDSPAKKAGIKPQDQIAAINNKDTTSMSVNDAAKLIRGKAGTKVTVVVIRIGVDNPIKIELTRAQITVKTLTSKIEGDTAIVTLNRFGDNTNSEWDSAVNEITTKGIKKMILDLRNDPGGLLEDAIHVAGDFLTTKDVVLQQEDPNGKRQPFYNKTDGRLQDVQVVILVNKGSASASEIVTGALRDHKKAKVVGETSFGKGTVQTVTNLDDGSALHITIAKWLTPNGTWVHGKGIDPDVKVDLTEANVKAGIDPQLDKAKELLK